jgi:GT2 family glycosyltransferase
VAEPTQAAKIFRISLDEPLRPVTVEDRYRQAVLVVTAGGSVVGQIWLPALTTIPVDLLRETIAADVGEWVWRRELRETVLLAGRGPETEPRKNPGVSVVVCTRDRADQLRSCLESLGALSTPPTEVLVVDNYPSDDTTRLLCEEFPVRYLLEPHPGQSRARNLGIIEAAAELVAFTDDDCVVDEHWLDSLGQAFDDPLTMAATGFVAPLELETRAQCLFEMQGGFPKHFERTVFDNVSRSPVTSAGLVGAGANMVFRRSVFEEIGLFAEDLGPGTPARAADDSYQMYKLLAAGYRVEFDPGRIVLHRHRRDEASLRRILFDYGCASVACSVRLLIRHREPAAMKVFAWWIGHVGKEIRSSLRDPDWLPLRITLAEGRGVLSGPWRLLGSKLSRRGVPPLRLPNADSRPAARPVVGEAEAPPLSVVVPSRNRRELLGKLLDALARQSYPPSRFETIVVLDGSEDDSAEMVRSFDAPYRLRLLEHENVGAATSRNRGTRLASAAHVVFVDDDIIPDPELLATHAQAHQTSPDGHLALGRCPPVVAGAGFWGQALRTWWEDHYRRKGEPGHRWTCIDFDGGNVSFPKQLFLAAGGFDEDFRGRREEWELGTRLLERGVRFAYYPEAIAWHHLDTRLETSLRHQRQHGRDDVLLAEKHPQLKPQLPLAAFFLDLPPASRKLTLYGPKLARLYETARLRRYWHGLVRKLFVNAYLLGLEDAFQSSEQFSAFVSSILEEGVDIRPLELHEIGPISTPPTGSVELAVADDSNRYASVAVAGPGEDWDWEIVTDRVVGRISDAARQTVLLDRLAAAQARITTREGEPAGAR